MEQPERKLDLKRAVSINEALDMVPDTHLAPLVEYIEQLEKELDERDAPTRHNTIAEIERVTKERDVYKASWEQLTVEKAQSSWGEFQRLRKMLTDANDEFVRLQADIASAIGTTRYMDPPDGGSVTLAEQVRRMGAEIERLGVKSVGLERQLEEARTATPLLEAQKLHMQDYHQMHDHERDLRIAAEARAAELEAQVKRLLANEGKRIGDQLRERAE